ncbi:MAG: transcription elongation factor GreA [Candidatus Nealsonbacteria bacterium]|nr:transcription elongation factor GreA [Candidatus Nealsonbacteria bacterium]
MIKYFTQEGLEKLKKELEHLEKVARKEVVKRIRDSAAHGDLKENAGYHAAKEDQSFIEGRIIQLKEIISQAKAPGKMERGVVQIGSVVYLESKDGKEKFQIVESEEADISLGKISRGSSLGKALLGKKKGETVEFEVPDGIKKCKILDIK